MADGTDIDQNEGNIANSSPAASATPPAAYA
jgi:hypothetical protein